MTRTLELTKNLIARKSNTPDDAGCQDLLISLLEPLGFKCEKIKSGDVDNLYARKGTEAPFFVFAGHTDVVPSGPVDQWISPPFEPTIKDDKLYGRGAADMKTSIAAFIVSIEEFLKETKGFKGSIGLIITSDEEGVAVDGTVKVVELLRYAAAKPAPCTEDAFTKILLRISKVGVVEAKRADDPNKAPLLLPFK